MADIYQRLDEILTDKFTEDMCTVFDYNYERERKDLWERLADEDDDAHEILVELGYDSDYMDDEDNIDELANALADKGHDHIFCRLIRVQRAAVALKGIQING